MAIAHDAAFESHTTGTVGSQNQAAFTWTHTPVGTPRGVLVFVFTNADADYITSVTYGTEELVQLSEAADTAGEPGRTTLFFSGETIPTGAQTVTVNRINNATSMYAISITITAATDRTGITGVVIENTDGTLAEVNVNDGSPGTNSLRYAAINSGLAAIPAVGASSTALLDIDYGNRVVRAVRETTAGQGSRPVGFTSGTTDDRAAIYCAVKELFGIKYSQSIII